MKPKDKMLKSDSTKLARTQAGLANRQRSRLLVALALLLVSLGAVLVRDREFWFASSAAIESDVAAPKSAATANSGVSAKTTPAPQALTAQNKVAPKASTKAAAVPEHNDAVKPASTVVAAKRHVLPPLQVEVIAGDTHHTVQPGSNATKVEISGDSNRVSSMTTSVASLPTNAAQRESLTGGIVPQLRQTVDSSYPLLGPRMKVQGSVVLQAVIGADGAIENLRVLSGPAILTAAAQQAVREWRFKPYLQNGKAVETKATITVNFSIRISDNPAKTS